MVLPVIIISLSFIPLAEAAEWVYYNTDHELNNSYYDAESITHPPGKNIVRVWEKTIYTEGGREFMENIIGTKTSDVSESREFYEINCITREFRNTDSIGLNSSDRVVFNVSNKEKNWYSIPPESIEEALYKRMCDPKISGRRFHNAEQDGIGNLVIISLFCLIIFPLL